MNRPGSNSNRRKRGATAASEPVTRVRTPNKWEREVLGTVTGMLGGSRVTVRCMDSATRMCRIKGKMKKRMWIREGDIVIVVPWDIQDEKGDVVWRYTGPQAEWLRRQGYLNAPDA